MEILEVPSGNELLGAADSAPFEKEDPAEVQYELHTSYFEEHAAKSRTLSGPPSSGL